MAVAMSMMGWSFNPLDLPSALAGVRWTFEPGRVIGFAALFACGVALAYSFLLLLSSTSVWLVRNENLMELWWLFTTLMCYPARHLREGLVGTSSTTAAGTSCPALLVVNVPADLLAEALAEPGNIALLVAASAVLLFLSRRFFFYALRSYSMPAVEGVSPAAGRAFAAPTGRLPPNGVKDLLNSGAGTL